jgi:hypothetical protein
MKKYITWSIACAFIACTNACVDDRGNYDYLPVEEIFPAEILGLEDDLSFQIGTTVELQPDYKGLDEDLSKYEFTWYAYPRSAVGYAPQRDTIGNAPALSFLISYPPDEAYVLVLEVKEKSTGLMVNRKMTITTTSPFSNGWFVVNDLNDQTDVDFITPDGQVNEDVLSTLTGEKLLGKGVKILLQSGYYNHDKILPDGTITRLANQTVFHVLSDRDMRTYNAASFELYKTWEDEFFATPEVRKPQDLFVTYMGHLFLINDGKLHYIMGMTDGPGKFAYQKLGEDDLYPCVLSYDFAQACNVFGRTTSSFFTGDYAVNLSPVLTGSGEPAVNMEHDMLWMGLRLPQSSRTKAWAIMCSKAQPVQHHLVDITANSTTNPISDFHLLDPSLGVLDADVYGVHPTHSAAFYFAKGNQLSYFQKGDLLGDDEVDLYTFPAGETIAHVAKNPSTPNLEILTNSGDTWKLYLFELAGSGNYPYLVNPNAPAPPDPVAVYTGAGHARYVLYR